MTLLRLTLASPVEVGEPTHPVFSLRSRDLGVSGGLLPCQSPECNICFLDVSDGVTFPQLFPLPVMSQPWIDLQQGNVRANDNNDSGGSGLFGWRAPGHSNQMPQPHVDGNYQILKIRPSLFNIGGSRLLRAPL